MPLKLFFCWTFVICFTGFQNVWNQTTKVSGTVLDGITKVPIPFVNVLIKNSFTGTITDENGYFSLETRNKADTLLISAVGFKKKYILLKPKESNKIEVLLEPDNVELTEVNIRYEGNPAEMLLKKVIERKPENDFENLESYYSEIYNKVEIDVYNINENLKKNPIIKPFGFIFEYTDSIGYKGKKYLPAFLTESISDRYRQKSPPVSKEIIKALSVAGSNNENVGQFTGDMYQSVNIYRNFLVIAQKSFVSPISASSIFFYKFYLDDSVSSPDGTLYKIVFYPRRKQDYTFNGEMWIHDSTFAVKSIYLEISENVNVNFIKGLEAHLDFKYIDGRWFPSSEIVQVDFNLVSKNALGFLGRKTTLHNNQKPNFPIPDSILKNPNNIIIVPKASEKTLEFWNDNRPVPLSKREEGIYKMIDTIKSTPTYRLYRSLGNLLTTGYLIVGPVELGQYYKVISFNPVEGYRLRLGGRSSMYLSERFMIEGWAAYGFTDKKFKYRGGLYYHLNKRKNPWRLISIRYKSDLEQFSISEGQWDHDNLLNSILRWDNMRNLLFVKHLETSYEHEWFNGFTQKLTFLRRSTIPVGNLTFVRGDDTNQVFSKLTTSEFTLSTRIAFREKYIVRRIDRLSTGTRFPVILIDYTTGIKGLWDSDISYHKLRIQIEDRVRLNPVGFFDFRVDAGKIWGAVPWPFLFNHPGNTTYMYDPRAFNLMNNLEFVGDEYTAIFLSYHFDGFFFNRIPGFRKLKWREVITANALYSSLRNYDAHSKWIQFPQQFAQNGFTPALPQPYYEIGFGIENIFRVFRIHFIWRLTNQNPDRNNDQISDFKVPRWGIRGMLYFRF